MSPMHEQQSSCPIGIVTNPSLHAHVCWNVAYLAECEAQYWHERMASCHVWLCTEAILSCAQGTLTGRACSARQYKSPLGRSACPATLGSAGLGGLIWRSRRGCCRPASEPSQATACWQGAPLRELCWPQSIVERSTLLPFASPDYPIAVCGKSKPEKVWYTSHPLHFHCIRAMLGTRCLPFSCRLLSSRSGLGTTAIAAPHCRHSHFPSCTQKLRLAGLSKRGS